MVQKKDTVLGVVHPLLLKREILYL